jgi:symplekin
VGTNVRREASAPTRRESSSAMIDDAALTETENMSDDDNAQLEIADAELENEDPLLLAIDDLEGRVVVALDDVKLHPGVRTDSSQGAPTVHEELATILRPVIEVAAHTAPSVARTYHRGVGPEGVESSMDDVYERIISDLVLPVILQIAQSDTIPAKRGASLEFFRTLWKEYHKSGSWLDNTITGPQQGPYGAGASHHHHNTPAGTATAPAIRVVQKRRQLKRLAREGEILRYWIEASIACLTPGVFTSDESEGAVASRGIIAASASIRPALSHISQRIKDADDRGAARMYAPVMKMVEGVLKKMFLGSGESVRSACIKFLEIVVMCCSRRPKDSTSRRRGQNVSLLDYLLRYILSNFLISPYQGN